MSSKPSAGLAVHAAVLIGVFAGLGWIEPFVGLVAPTSLVVGLLVLTPLFLGWTPAVQSAFAAAGVAAYLWCLPSGGALPERLPSLILAALGAITTSVIAASFLEREREAARGEHQKLARKTHEALAGLEVRAGLASLAHGGGTVDLEADDPVAAIERIAVRLGRNNVEARKDILREREQNAHFIGQAAHEFRTPLAVIQTAAEALKLYSGRMSSHAQHVRLTKIEESVQQMTDLLRNALTFSRADVGKIKIERESVDLRALAQEVARDVGQTFPGHEVTVTIRGTARLPQVDESLAREIFINLITNAAKYSPEGGPIEVEVFTGSTEVRIRVTDHGIGIASDDQEHIFDPFRRGGNVGDIPGTGLGLAITKRAVETHGGTIGMESKLGVGTTFTVTLPDRVEPNEPLRRAG